MRKVALLSALLLTMSLGFANPGQASVLVQMDLGPGAFMSDNVTYIGTIPIDSPGVAAAVRTVGNQRRLYVSGAKGLTIWNVTDPALPTPLGHYTLPHFQNENMGVSADGSKAIISTDTFGVDRNGSTSNGVHILDTTDPMNIRRLGFVQSGNHTSMCPDPACNWIYGSTGVIIDATNPAAPKLTGKRWGNGGHALNRDPSGLVISDSNPRLVLDVTDPSTPKVLASGKPTVKLPDGLLQHNNVRTRATEWVPRDPLAPDYNDPALRPGELLIGNSESNVRPNCGANAGGLSSWSMANFDKGQPLKQLQTFRPVNGNWVDGNPAVNGLGCSGHWFTVRDISPTTSLIAASWYEHGIRFIEVDAATGTFKEVGFFNAVATQAGASHWIDDRYVYNIDYARGIDIVRFDPAAETPSESEIQASWLANLGAVGEQAAMERYACRAAAADGA
jgi:hypothetical protein